MPLSEFKINKAKPREKAYKLTDGEGLFLLVKPNGSKLWQQKYHFMGKERLLSHGKYPVVSLAKARTKREEAKRHLDDDKDPATEKRLEELEAKVASRTSFLLVAEEYLSTLEDRELAAATLKKKHWHIYSLAEVLHKRPINEITSAELLHLLKNIENSGRRETAKKLRGTLSAIFRLAIVTLRAETDPTYALRGALLPPKVVGRSAITDETKFGQLLRDFDEFTGWQVITAAMKFQILTMTRPGETRGAKKSEFDLEKEIWTIPPERMKMRREHKIPLSQQALEIVKERWPVT
jgi:integrase